MKISTRPITISLFSLSLIILYAKTEHPLALAFGIIGGVLAIILADDSQEI